MIGEDFDAAEGAPNSDLNVLDFLKNFSNSGYENNGQTVTFETFLAAVKTVGFTELLTNGDPYLVLVPTDEAFSRLPKDKLDAYMSDPKALADLLRNHIVAGYIPRGSLNVITPLPNSITSPICWN